LLELFGRAAHLVASLVELIARLLCLLPRLEAVDALTCFVELADHAALFVFEALEFASDGFALCLVFGGGERGLKLLQAAIHVLLTAGELAQTGEDLELLTFLGSRGRRGGSFGFVATLGVAEVELFMSSRTRQGSCWRI
jgi:hypothetical protein